jgi:glycosyltransferase involved in cell wall biosynthesis
MGNKKICFVSGSSPEFLGGVSLYQKNLISYAKKKKLGYEFVWVYAGDVDREYKVGDLRCVEIKSMRYLLTREFSFSRRVRNFLEKNNFDVINTHANWGYCLRGYKRKENQKLIHIYHGVTMPYMKIQFLRFGFFRFLLYPLLPFFYLIERPPMEKADEIICVSEKVKRDLFRIYGDRKNVYVIRTGVDLGEFKNINKVLARKKLGLKSDLIYGLYSGRGGHWNKGLDRAVKLGREMVKINPDFRLVVIGADERKCRKYLNEDFVIYKGVIKRDELPLYYSACDFFFSLSRYEGGAPTLALSEAIACGCLTVCSKDMDAEILKDGKDCLVVDGFGAEEGKRIIDLVSDKKRAEQMKKSAKMKIKELDLDSWGKKFWGVVGIK